MQIQIFSIPILEGENELNELNHFLRAHRVAFLKKRRGYTTCRKSD